MCKSTLIHNFLSSDRHNVMHTVYAEVVVPRSIPDYNGGPTDGAWREVTCYVPPGGTVVLVKGYMKNEPEGSLQVPQKPDTDSVGDIEYRRCPLERGECDIGWAAGKCYLSR